MNKLIVLFISVMICLLFSSVVFSIRINEVMADPIADESLNEWVELYNDEIIPINLSGWRIGDNNDNDSLNGGLYGGSGTILEPGSYAIITDDATRVYDNFDVDLGAVRLYIDDSSIGNGLSNSGETIFLYDSNLMLVDSVSYSSTEEGYSITFYNNTWLKANVTPGYSNEGKTITAEPDSGCDFQVYIVSDYEFFDSPENFSFKILVKNIFGGKANITLYRDITDQYGALEKSYANITNEVTSQKTYSYSPNLAPGAYIINARITPDCNDSDAENDHDSKLVVIKGESPSDQPFVFIERLYDLGSDDKARYGQTIKAKIIAYKGNSTMEAVELWAEIDGDRISKNTKTSVYDKFTTYTLTLPVQLYPNCDEDYPGGNATLFLDGFGMQDSYSFSVEGITKDMCEIVQVEKSDDVKTGVVYSLEYIPETVIVSTGFSSNVKIVNNDDSAHKFELWSYVYKGNKCYSGSRESNKVVEYVASGSYSIISLDNLVPEAADGIYKFKVKILKDDLKTPYEITDEIVIKNSITKDNISVVEDYLAAEESFVAAGPGPAFLFSEKIKGDNSPVLLSNYRAVYESTSVRAKGLVPYIFSSALLFLVVFLIMRKL